MAAAAAASGRQGPCYNTPPSYAQCAISIVASRAGARRFLATSARVVYSYGSVAHLLEVKNLRTQFKTRAGVVR
ncbi:MAG: hypothetical protein ACLGI6_21540, partial [Gammaproteobacteria bacterium]